MRFTALVPTALALIAGGVHHANAMELRLQVGLIPGYDELELTSLDLNESGASLASTNSTLEDEDGTSIGLLLLWAPSNGVGFMQGLEFAYRDGGAKNYDVSQIGVGYRLGAGINVMEGLRIDAGGRIMVGYAKTDDAIDSQDGIVYPGGTIIAERDSAEGLGLQLGLFVGISYRFLSNVVVGAEVGYEYTYAYLLTDYIYNEVSGDGIAASLSAGLAF